MQNTQNFAKYAHPSHANTHILFLYDSNQEYDGICKKDGEYAHPLFLWKIIIKYEKNAEYVYLMPCLPAAGRPGVTFAIHWM
jgi:hypothetical protein